MRNVRWLVGGIVAAAALVGCSGDSGDGFSEDGTGGTDEEAGAGGSTSDRPTGSGGSSNDSGAPGDTGGSGVTDGSGGRGPQGGTGQIPAAALLRRATSCDDLTDALREEIRARLVGMSSAGTGTGGVAGGVSMPGLPALGGSTGGGGFPATTGGARATGGVSSSGAASNPPPGEGDPVFTGTNTQIPNIDEPDFLKTDGTYLFVVQNQRLSVALARPANELAEITSADLEGSAREMFLAEGASAEERRVVVYSWVPATNVSGDGSGGTPSMSGPASGAIYGWNDYAKVTVFRFDGADLAIESEYYFEGSYVSARRQGDVVRSLLSVYRGLPALRTYATEADYWKAELLVLQRLIEEGTSVDDLSSEEVATLVQAALTEVLADENEAAIEQVNAADWLPRAFVRVGDQLVQHDLPCEDFYVPRAGTLDLALTYLPEVDLAAPGSDPSGAALLGYTSTLYQNANVLVAASPSWLAFDANGRPRTELHVFDVSENALAYRASGSVPGFVKDQFSIDEHDGALRVVTTDLDPTYQPINHLYVLDEVDGTLELVGDAGEFAQTETVYSARFLGDTGYVVTFRQTDPLFVFDLSDPTAPTLVGELEIPGFSEYMHPIEGGYLLTIGSYEGSFGDLALRLFDVREPTNPTLLFDPYRFGEWGTSTAQVDHRAFTYFPERELLAIPFSGYEYDQVTGYSRLVNRMPLVHVSTSDGFGDRGSIDGAALVEQGLADNPECQSWDIEQQSLLERGTFIDDTLYAVARGGVIAADVTAPETPIAVLSLTQECVDAGVGGAVSMGGAFSAGGEPSAGSPPTGGVPAGGAASEPPSTTGGAGGEPSIDTGSGNSPSMGGAASE